LHGGVDVVTVAGQRTFRTHNGNEAALDEEVTMEEQLSPEDVEPVETTSADEHQPQLNEVVVSELDDDEWQD
jgi:hypothetical protein